MPSKASILIEKPPASSGNGRASQLDASEENFSGPGFRFVRYFLILILLVVGAMGVLIGILGWHLGMEVTVKGQGNIEPKIRHQVKAEIAGLIAQVHVRQGQQVAKGDRLVTLDDTEWRTELGKVNKELEVNRSRIAEIETQIRQEREVLQAEMDRARVERETAALQLTQVRKEYELYYALFPPSGGRSEKSIDGLLPVRLRETVLRRTEVDLDRAHWRLDAVEGRGQEIRTLDRLREKLEQDRALLEHRLDRTVLRASMAGTVLTGDLHRRAGDRVQAGEAVVELAELGTWQAKVLVQEVDIPKVKVGQAVRLYVNAFPYMEYRIFEGTVEEVPARPAAISPPTGNPEVGTMGGGYPVKISIRDAEVSDGEHLYRLAYGMSAEAKVVVERGRIVDLLWRKLLRVTGKVGQHDFYLLKTEAGK